jgi:hypothetical protein
MIYSTKQIGEGGPIMDDQKLVLDEIRNLSNSDVPESKISIAPDGYLSIK